MIFIRANYTGPCPAEKMARVFYCCTHMQKSALLRLFKWGPQEPLAGLVSSEGVSPLLSRVTINHPLWFLTRFSAVFISLGCHSSPIKRSLHLFFAFCISTKRYHTPCSLVLKVPQSSWCTTASYKKAALMHPCSSVRGKRLNLSLSLPSPSCSPDGHQKNHHGQLRFGVNTLSRTSLWCAAQTHRANTSCLLYVSLSLSPAHLSQSAH